MKYGECSVYLFTLKTYHFILPKIYLIVDRLYFQKSLVKPAMVLLLPSISLLVETDCPCVQSNPVTF